MCPIETARDKISTLKARYFGGDNLALLDEELVEALRDETARAILREVVHLPERGRRIVLGIVRQFEEERDTSDGR